MVKIPQPEATSFQSASHFKILHLTSTLASAGAETMMVQLINNNADNKHVVCAVYSGGSYKSKLNKIGIGTYTLIHNPLLIPFIFTNFFLIVLKEKPDIIHSYLFLDNIIARVIGKLTGKKVLCSKRDSDLWKPWFVHIINRLTAWLADATVTNFKDGIGELKKDGIASQKIIYIPNGKSVADYNNITLSKNEAKKQLGLEQNDFVICFTGRLVWYKGHEYLIRAFSKVLFKYPNAKLLIVGEGKMRKYLESQTRELNLSSSIIFLGNRTDIPQILRATDIFVSPSLRDGMPGAVMEAMAAGLPIVATNADGSKDLIKNYENGIFVPIKNSNAISEKVIELINDKDLAIKLGKNAYNTIAKDFTVEKMVSAYQKLYASLVGDS